jgi:hypothetical protein
MLRKIEKLSMMTPSLTIIVETFRSDKKYFEQTKPISLSDLMTDRSSDNLAHCQGNAYNSRSNMTEKIKNKVYYKWPDSMLKFKLKIDTITKGHV